MQQGWRPERRAAWVFLHTKAPDEVCMRRASQLLGQKSWQRWHKRLLASKSDFLRCSLPGWWTNIERRIKFTISNFRPFTWLPKWKSKVQKQCLARTPHREGDLCSLAFMSWCYMETLASMQAGLSSIYFCAWREEGRALWALDANNSSVFISFTTAHLSFHICCAKKLNVHCPRKLRVSVKWETDHVCNKKTKRAQRKQQAYAEKLRMHINWDADFNS